MMNPDPRNIRKRLEDLEQGGGDFCSPLYVSPFNMKQLKSILFKNCDKRVLFGPIFGNEQLHPQRDDEVSQR